jgi:FKBP-type peptidyl-prolyl cis-trans isomerase (trigger factor)
MEARLKSDLEAIGQTLESFLAEQKKSREEMRQNWKDAADKRAKIRLILSEIARNEKLEPNKEDLDRELDHAKKHYPNADPEVLSAHIAHALRNEMVLQRLESIS